MAETPAGALTHNLENVRPYDLDKQAIDDLFGEAQQWLDDGKPIETEAEASALEELQRKTRNAKNVADANRVIENEPFDTGKKAVQARYNPLIDRADLVILAVNRLLTPWRNKLAEEQKRRAEEIRLAAEAASQTAQHVAEVAGSDIGAQEIAAGAEDTARRLLKSAAKAEKRVGKGLRMRTVWDHEITNLKAALNHLYVKDRQALEGFVSERARAVVSRGGTPVMPGVTFTERKEAY